MIESEHVSLPQQDDSPLVEADRLEGVHAIHHTQRLLDRVQNDFTILVDEEAVFILNFQARQNWKKR